MNELAPVSPVSPLRQRLIDDMTVRHFSHETQRNYLRDVGRFATWLGRSPHSGERNSPPSPRAKADSAPPHADRLLPGSRIAGRQTDRPLSHPSAYRHRQQSPRSARNRNPHRSLSGEVRI